jgi:hypothetical protein
MTRNEVLDYADSQSWKLSSTFGYPGQGGYTEIYNAPDGTRHKISNGPWNAAQPFTWSTRAIEAKRA